MNKIACIGDKSSVLGFMSIGFSVFVAGDVSEAREILLKITKQDEFSIIYITDEYYEALGQIVSRFNEKPFPAIISIPGREGSKGTGLAAIKALTEKAIGADIALNS